MMLNSIRFNSKLCSVAPLGVLLFVTLCTSFTGCGPAQSVYHDGNFSEEQKVAAQMEYQTVEDEESQGSNKKKKKSVKR